MQKKPGSHQATGLPDDQRGQPPPRPYEPSQAAFRITGNAT